jgi:N-methylhydantoinase B
MAHGDTRIIPIELQESLYPMRIEEFALREDSAGGGKFRGGLGFRKRYAVLGPCSLWANFDRIACPPWGVRGGLAAKPGEVRVLKKGAETAEIFYKSEGTELDAGDTIFVETGGGGGYGPPSERATANVVRDLRLGYISPAAAERDYGLVIAADGTMRRNGVRVDEQSGGMA